jgi:DNA-binding MarR family transcriptional regulator
MTNQPTAEQISIPALLRAARGAYGEAIGAELRAAGFDDLPANAPFVLGGMANHGGAPGDLVRQLGVSKQAASQLIDTLVLRGYLERNVDPEDGRRLTLTLTQRGKAAAAAVGAGVRAVDAELMELCSAEEIAGLRAGLVGLITVRERREDLRR